MKALIFICLVSLCLFAPLTFASTIRGGKLIRDKDGEPISIGNYTFGKELGRGAFGVVYTGINNSTGTKVAIKILKGAWGVQLEDEQKIFEVIKGAPNILPFLDLFEDIDGTGSVVSVMEFFGAPELRKAFVEMNEHQIKVCVYQILSTLAFIHDRNVTHDDVHEGNILMDVKNLHAKLIDWGISHYYPQGIPQNYGKQYNDEVRLGDLLLAMLLHVNGYDLELTSTFHKLNEVKRSGNESNSSGFLQKDKKIWTDFVEQHHLEKIDSKAWDLLDKMVLNEVHEQISAKNALAHPYFDDIRNIKQIEK